MWLKTSSQSNQSVFSYNEIGWSHVHSVVLTKVFNNNNVHKTTLTSKCHIPEMTFRISITLIKIRKSMMKTDNSTSLPSLYWDVLTNMPGTMTTNSPPPPMHVDGTNSWLRASIGKKAHYYSTFSIFYLLNHHVLTRFDANYCITFSVILTHSHS